MRQIGDAVAVEIEPARIVPVVAAAVERPAVRARLPPLVSTGWMLPAKRFPANTLLVGAVADADADVVAGDRGCRSTRLPWPLSMNTPERVAGNLVGGDGRVVDRLQQEAVGPMAAIGDEAVAASVKPFENISAAPAALSRKTLRSKRLSVGIHVVQAVAHALDVVVPHLGAVDEGEVDPVAGVADRVAGDDMAARVPDVDAVAAAILVERHGAQLALAGLEAVLKRIDGLDRLGAPTIVLPSIRAPSAWRT